MHPAVINQVHVVHVGRTGRHAGQAGKTPVDVPNDIRGRCLLGLEHVLDQVDSSARAIQLVAQEQIGGTGREAEPAVNAAPDDTLGILNLRALAL